MYTSPKGSGGPYDAPTGYVAPVMNLDLPANTTYEYTFYLVLGDVSTIRAYAQQVVVAGKQDAVQQAAVEDEAEESTHVPAHVKAATSATWAGCEQFPGFGSARDSVTLVADDDTSSGGGVFNITTSDFLSSRTCDGDPDLVWSHQGTFQCANDVGDDADATQAAFNRSSLWIEPSTRAGVAFAKVCSLRDLKPHGSLCRSSHALDQ